MPAGRPTKLTEELIGTVRECLQRGHYRSVAAKSCGISPRTFCHWLAQGREFPDGMYGQFLRSVLEAEAEAEKTLVEKWTGAADRDWQAARDYLERKYPERYGRYRGELRELTKRVKQLEAQRNAAEHPETHEPA